MQLPQELVSACARGGEIMLLLPRGLGNVHQEKYCPRKILVFEMQLGRALKKAAEKGKERREEPSHYSPHALLTGLCLQPMWK